MGLTSPHLEAFAVARGSATAIFKIVDTTAKIDPLGEHGLKLESLKGNVEFKDIHFEYPSRKDVKVRCWFYISIIIK